MKVEVAPFKATERGVIAASLPAILFLRPPARAAH
jgi:hypothetical protein